MRHERSDRLALRSSSLASHGLLTQLLPIPHLGYDSIAWRWLLTLAGGDQSLVISTELPEDDPHAGEADLRALVAGCQRVLFVGVCFLLHSAPV